jgi:hypothetical protein
VLLDRQCFVDQCRSKIVIFTIVLSILQFEAADHAYNIIRNNAFFSIKTNGLYVQIKETLK